MGNDARVHVQPYDGASLDSSRGIEPTHRPRWATVTAKMRRSCHQPRSLDGPPGAKTNQMPSSTVKHSSAKIPSATLQSPIPPHSGPFGSEAIAASNPYAHWHAASHSLPLFTLAQFPQRRLPHKPSERVSVHIRPNYLAEGSRPPAARAPRRNLAHPSFVGKRCRSSSGALRTKRCKADTDRRVKMRLQTQTTPCQRHATDHRQRRRPQPGGPETKACERRGAATSRS